MADARDGFVPVLDSLRVLYPTLLEVGSPPVGPGYRRVAVFAHGWYMRCHRSAQAILELDAAGFAEEAAPLRRSIIEHTVALRWLVAEGDQVADTLARGHAHIARRRHTALSDARWTSVNLDDLKELIIDIGADGRDASRDHLLHFTAQLQRYGEVHELPGWLAETSHAHPSYESATAYVNLPDGTPLDEPREPVWQVPFVTTQLLRAVLAVRLIFDPPPWEDILSDVIQRYRTVINEVRTQDGLTSLDW